MAPNARTVVIQMPKTTAKKRRPHRRSASMRALEMRNPPDPGAYSEEGYSFV